MREFVNRLVRVEHMKILDDVSAAHRIVVNVRGKIAAQFATILPFQECAQLNARSVSYQNKINA